MVLEEQRTGKARRSRGLLGLFFIGSGINHFVIPATYERIVPPGWGDPKTLVRVSGVAEVAGVLVVAIGSAEIVHRFAEAAWIVLRAVEEEVLEEVGQAGSSALLVA